MLKKYISRKILKIFLITIFCVILIFLSSKNFFNPLRGVIIRVIYPFQKAFYIVGRETSGYVNFLQNIRNLRKENEKLIRENYILSAELADLKSADRENQILREQLKLAPKNSLNLEASFVIGQDPQRLGSWLLIDKGSQEGINVGMPVIVYEGILVGRVSEVFPHSAQVEMIFHTSSVINVSDNETETKGVISGEYGLGIIMDMISQKDVVNAGDTIVTSGLSQEIPKGLLIGKVQEVMNSPDRLYKQATVTPRVKYSDIDLVFVVKNK